jgi:hypothetical protein
VRPIPWMVRLGLFAVGFGIGLSRYPSGPPQQTVIIEMRSPTQESTTAGEPRAAVTAMPQSDRECPGPLLNSTAVVRTASVRTPRF